MRKPTSTPVLVVALAAFTLFASLTGCPPTVGSGSSSESDGGGGALCEPYCGDIPIHDLQVSCTEIAAGIVRQCDPSAVPPGCHPIPTTHPATCPDGSVSHPYCCPSN